MEMIILVTLRNLVDEIYNFDDKYFGDSDFNSKGIFLEPKGCKQIFSRMFGYGLFGKLNIKNYNGTRNMNRTQMNLGGDLFNGIISGAILFEDLRTGCVKWLKSERYDNEKFKRCFLKWIEDNLTNSVLPNKMPGYEIDNFLDILYLLVCYENENQNNVCLANAEALMLLILYCLSNQDNKYNDELNMENLKPIKSILYENDFFKSISNINSLSRNKEISNVVSLLNTNQAVLIYGEYGVGKSYIVEKVAKYFEQLGYYISYSTYTNRFLNIKLNNVSNSNKKSLCIINDIPIKNLHELCKTRLENLLFQGYKVLLISRWCQKDIEKYNLISYKVKNFSNINLWDYFYNGLIKENKTLSNIQITRLKNDIFEIINILGNNTDLFIQICYIIWNGSLNSKEILSSLKKQDLSQIFVNGEPFCEYIYNIYFKKDVSFTSVKEKLYLCFMAMLPSSGISYDQMKTIMYHLDPNDEIRQKFSSMGVILCINEDFQFQYEDDNYISNYRYFIDNSLRNTINLIFPQFLNDCSDIFIKEFKIFIECIIDKLIISKNLKNTTVKEDKNSYLNFLLWQRIGLYLCQLENILYKISEIHPKIILKLLYTIFDNSYFSSLYIYSQICLNIAHKICVNNNLSSYEFYKRQSKLNLIVNLSSDDILLLNDNIKILKVDWSKDFYELTNELIDKHFFIHKIDVQKDYIKIYFIENYDYTLRKIEIEKDKEQIKNLFCNSFILPKTTWRETPYSMVCNGLEIKRYEAWGIFIEKDGNEYLVSYIDRKILHKYEKEDTQIGFAVTDVLYRSQNLTRYLLNNLELRYYDSNHFFTTHEQNGSMNRLAEDLNYKLLNKNVKNRIVSDIWTYYYRKQSLLKRKS